MGYHMDMIDGNVGVKCTLVVRGIKGEFQDSDTYAGTTSRSGQRFANAVAAGNQEFILSSCDVSQVPQTDERARISPN